MSYAGHVLDMIQRMKNNRDLLKKRDGLFSGMSKKIVHSYRRHPSHQKELTQEQKDQLRARLIKDKRVEMIKRIVALTLAIVIVAVLFAFIRGYVNLEDFMIYQK